MVKAQILRKKENNWNMCKTLSQIYDIVNNDTIVFEIIEGKGTLKAPEPYLSEIPRIR